MRLSWSAPIQARCAPGTKHPTFRGCHEQALTRAVRSRSRDGSPVPRRRSPVSLPPRASSRRTFKTEEAVAALADAAMRVAARVSCACSVRAARDHLVRRRGRRRSDAPALHQRLRGQAQRDDGERRQGRADHRPRGVAVPDPAGPEGWNLALRYGGRPRGDPHRRIGRTSSSAIKACLAYMDAQHEYAEKDRGGGAGGVRATHRQPAGKAGRALLAGEARRGRKSARRVGRRRRRRRLSRPPAAFPLSRHYDKVLTGRGRMRPAAPSTTWCAAR